MDGGRYSTAVGGGEVMSLTTDSVMLDDMHSSCGTLGGIGNEARISN